MPCILFEYSGERTALLGGRTLDMYRRDCLLEGVKTGIGIVHERMEG